MELHFCKLLILIGLFSLVQTEEVRKGKQAGTGLTFAIPALNFLGGNNNGGNLFGQQTFTRTLVSTVSTVTTASFRTCTSIMAGIMPCAGRRKRSADQHENNELDQTEEYLKVEPVEPTPAMQLIIGTTTISNPVDVTEYLEAHKLPSNSIIYPKDVILSELKGSSSDVPDGTTVLYPSHDIPEEQFERVSQDDFDPTTEAPALFDSIGDDTTPNPVDLNDSENPDKARLGLTTTVTTIIRVTSVATTIASGMMATLTVNYMGCAPPSYPISGLACT